MDDHRHFDDRSAIGDDHEAIFNLADEPEAGEAGEVRIWRLYMVGRGYDGVSSAMTLEDAREFAMALREEGIRVLRLESAGGEILDECDVVPLSRAAAR